ncbi:MAG: hypothetical protein ACREIC_18315, partial [Limisphaerales bacterium]
VMSSIHATDSVNPLNPLAVVLKYKGIKEQNFTAMLAFLLDPKPSDGMDHGFRDSVLNSFLNTFLPKAEYCGHALKTEHRLGSDAGTIDVALVLDESVDIGIEVKIHDRSARNHQLEKYLPFCTTNLIYLVPGPEASSCERAYSAAKGKEGGNKLIAVSWNEVDDQARDESRNSKESSWTHGISIQAWLEDLKVREGDDHPGSPFIDWLIECIPDIRPSRKDGGDYPSLSLLCAKASQWWLLAEPAIKAARRPINSRHTTVGVPHGFGTDKAKRHGNSLCRIRTAKSYEEKKAENNLPHEDRLEIEIWSDDYVIPEVRARLQEWNGDGCNIKTNEQHLGPQKESVAVISVPEHRVQSEFESLFDDLRTLIPSDS